MSPVIFYLLKMLLCSGILYAYYHVALRNNRFHQWNRYYLLLATLLSLVLPLLQLPMPFSGREAPVISAYTTRIITLREFILKAPSTAPAVNYLQLAWYGYAVVTLLLLARTAYGCWKISRLIRNNTVQQLPPCRFIQSDQVKAPFSFFRYIFWTRDMSPDSADGQQILQHELAHVTEQHSIDKLLMELVCAICWINPFFHLFKRELAVVHEFIADKQAAGGKVADYAQVILQVSLQSGQLSFTNHFFRHPIQRRINMLLRQKSNFTIMKKLIALPIITGLIIFISCKQQPEAAPKPDATNITVEQLEAMNGEDIKSISMTDNIAILGTADGKKYRVNLEGTKYDFRKLNQKISSVKSEVFTFVDQPPVFPGGEEALAVYLSKNIRYPKTAVEKKITGTIFVQFVVDAYGTIKDAKIVGQYKGGGLEEESLRVVNSMPKWIPGKQNGNKVAVMFNLPIRYTLEDNNKLSLLAPFLLFKQAKDC
ncbi:M56 family metallopeptidase [uncultured Chitinophaga sp.]|jgi:TonB family C-terminal domain|uniref:M56 family metallopeptidase n=1 Tax=uncultured Chitinophaga sp. TaxID=339340 RepID=UPI00260C3A7A|nr:M56 family metallopeptidase [uncultured Chitinophaga sp.]